MREFILFKAQAGWLQHDFGHLSVFKSNKLNHFMHKFIISTYKVKKNAILKVFLSKKCYKFNK